MVGEARQSNGRKERTSFCIVDSQSVKNTDSAGNKGYDAGKKVSGIKRHIAVDTQGLPHAIHLTTANVTDRAGALAMFDRHRDGLNQVQNVLVDGGYTGKPFAAGVRSLLGAAVEVVKRNELHTFVVLPKRWVVERSFAWLEKCRRLWKNCERKLNTSLQMVVLAFATLNSEEIVNRFLEDAEQYGAPSEGELRYHLSAPASSKTTGRAGERRRHSPKDSPRCLRWRKVSRVPVHPESLTNASESAGKRYVRGTPGSRVSPGFASVRPGAPQSFKLTERVC